MLQFLKMQDGSETFLFQGHPTTVSLAYGSPKGTSVLTLINNQSLFFSKIGVCFFFENRSLFFENRSCFFLKSGFDFWKSEFVFFKNRSLFCKKSEFLLFKIGVCFLKIRVLAPDSALSFCS